jgi:peptidoglycan/xylan/chitin deacetylase (PgdA/CDA1 family)
MPPVVDVAAPEGGARRRLKRWLGAGGARRAARGTTVLIYHRVGGGSPDERDMRVADFVAQLDVLAAHDVVPLDTALDRLVASDERPTVVLTFDDGFADVYDNAWPLLRERGMPFTLYLAADFVGGTMHWDGSTAKAAGPALTWDQVREMAGSGLCTLGNHTHHHVRPEALTVRELDACTEAVVREVGVVPAHFAYPWGIPVPALEDALARRFRSAVTGHLGRNLPGADLLRLSRVPVRGSDPVEFFRAKLGGRLVPERTYAGLVSMAKRVGAHA